MSTSLIYRGDILFYAYHEGDVADLHLVQGPAIITITTEIKM